MGSLRGGGAKNTCGKKWLWVNREREKGDFADTQPEVKGNKARNETKRTKRESIE